MQGKIKVKDALRVTNGNLICGNENEEIGKVVRDSREVRMEIHTLPLSERNLMEMIFTKKQ